jgi:hypothetical protein
MSDASLLAERTFRAAAWPAALAAGYIAAGPLLFRPEQPQLAAALAATVAGLAALSTLAIAALLVFDAMLFRLAASHADEPEGLEAIDETLDRMAAKPRSEETRGLAERAAGTQRWQRRQRLSLAVMVAAAIAAMHLGAAT